jgi:NADPH-dependent 2,4-dienoyl-CoA reductase/sulfur reductase-like enzyme
LCVNLAVDEVCGMPGRLVVIGGDAGGMAAATNARRRDPDLEIVALEMGRWTSYSACGIPYLVGGVVTGGVDTSSSGPITESTCGCGTR